MKNFTEHWLFGNQTWRKPILPSYSPEPCTCDFKETVALIILSVILIGILILKVVYNKKALNINRIYKRYADLLQTTEDGKLKQVINDN